VEGPKNESKQPIFGLFSCISAQFSVLGAAAEPPKPVVLTDFAVLGGDLRVGGGMG
jgi:hypothetical protein